MHSALSSVELLASIAILSVLLRFFYQPSKLYANLVGVRNVRTILSSFRLGCSCITM